MASRMAAQEEEWSRKVEEQAAKEKKRKAKGADWIVANDVSGAPGESVMGGDANTVHIVTEDGVESWEPMGKDDVALGLAERIGEALALEAVDD